MKPFRLFNTYSGKLEEFKPLCSGEVRMYTCGPTVYDYAHIGNFRAFVFEDLLRRFLLFKDYQVHHVMNLTDVDDKTIAGARREGKSLNEYTQKYTDAFTEDLKTLNIFQKDHANYKLSIPPATAYIPQMIELIRKLIQRGHAYEKEGSVYYRVASFGRYGQLSKKDLTQNIAGARVDTDEYEKEAGSDFALWKKKKEEEPSWPSPWGEGRPGWHIECSVMSMEYLGETFDIHAGGEDLIFPHHENEIAQSEGVTGAPFVRYWLHCRFLLVDGEKMSKSKGNFYTLRDLLKKGYDPMQIRYVLISNHYRQPLNFTLAGLEAAKEALERLDHFYARVTDPLLKARSEKGVLEPVFRSALERFEEALSDDLGIPEALASLFDTLREANQKMDKGEFSARDLQAGKQFLERVDSVLGLRVSEEATPPVGLLKLLREREEARAKKEFGRSDEIRRQIHSQGWLVKDGRPGESSQLKRKKRVWEND
jgi:cysteinyl-tRNA synthetase